MPKLDELNLKLGRKVDAGGLDAVPRFLSRSDLPTGLQFKGHDLWNAYEVSFLLPSGKPVVYHMQAIYDAMSPNIVESKSFKLYLLGLNFKTFADLDAFEAHISKDLEACVGSKMQFFFFGPEASPTPIQVDALNVDDLGPTQLRDEPDPTLLKTKEGDGVFAFKSHLLRSHCPVTNQPDWGTVYIEGEGPRTLVPESLLNYIIAFRSHQDFHEACCERIYADLLSQLAPNQLTVRCFYTRRGGLDINPVRSTKDAEFWHKPLWRQ